MFRWRNWITRLTTNQEIAGSSPVRNDVLSAWMAERSKAVDLSSIIVRCVGSNPTPGIFAELNNMYRHRARVVKGSDSKSDEHVLAGVRIPPMSSFF